MSKQASCIRVPKKHGEKALDIVKKLGFINKGLEIQRDMDFLYIPLVGKPSREELRIFKKDGLNYKALDRIFVVKGEQMHTLPELLNNELPSYLLARLPHSMDIVGDIAIIEIPHELDAFDKTVGRAILETNKNVRTVFAKTGAIAGTYRLRQIKFIAGEQRSETIHREYGCQYRLDVTKVYFSPRLSQEHNRVASQVNEHETVVDLFAGVGPFAVLIAKMHKDAKVYAIDANPHAFTYLKANIRLNRVLGKVHPFLGDARQVVDEKLLKIADHVIMNLPEKASSYVDVACDALRTEGGIIHFYCFARTEYSTEDLKISLAESVEKAGRKAEILTLKLIRETAPRQWQAVIEARIR